MSRLPQAFLDELRQRVTLSSVVGRFVAWDRHKTRGAKGDFWACCPFHGEKTPSFHVDDGKGLYYCFGCKASGDAIGFLTAHKGLQFFEAVAELAGLAGLALPTADPEAAAKEARRTSLYEVMALAQTWFRGRLLDARAGIQGRAYLATRDVGDALSERFGLGYAPIAGLMAELKARGIAPELQREAGLLGEDKDNDRLYERFRDRLMFPIHDRQGRVVGFGGRALRPEQEPKYLNSPETILFRKRELLWNLHRAREPARESGLVVAAEGYMDVLALDKAGIAAVAPLGTALSPEQLEALWRLAPEPVLCLDGDKAGQAAAQRAIAAALPLLKPGRSLGIVTLPEEKDPDEYLNSYGAEALSGLLKTPVALFEAFFQGLVAGKDVATPERQAALNAEAAAAVAAIADADVRKAYETALGERLAQFWKERKTKAPKPKFHKPAPAAGGGGDAGGGGWGADELEKMNGSYAVVITGQKASIMRDGSIDAGHSFERFSFMTVDAFRIWLANRLYRVGARNMPAAELWLTHPGRRQYRGIEFVPCAPGESAARDGYYNLWRGYTVQPRANPDLAMPWLSHVRESLAGGDDALYEWIVAWFASLVQLPRVRFGTSLVLRGGEGVGKTITGKIVGALIAPNYFLVDDPRYLTGQFNSHLAACLLLQADEGFWAGDKQAESRLKGLITSDEQMIEFKGVDAGRVRNYVHLLVTSNSDWAVPVGIDGRRYAVIDVKRRDRDHGYFGELAALYERDDARAALLHELAHWRIDIAALREVPKTAALFAQKVRSFDPETEFVYEFLDRGALPGTRDWPEWVTVEDFHKHYLKRCELMGVRRPQSVKSLGHVLARILPGAVRKKRTTTTGRIYVYWMPELAAARRDFEAGLKQPVDWGEMDEEMPAVSLDPL